MPKSVQAYAFGQPTVSVLPLPIGFETSPVGSTNTNYEIGQLGFTPPNGATDFFIYAGAGNWVEFATSGGDILSIVGTAPIAASTTAGIATISMTGPANVT